MKSLRKQYRLKLHCPTPHGVGGLKWQQPEALTRFLRSPTPHGVGGLKCSPSLPCSIAGRSHPSRGGWIEMRYSVPDCAAPASHPSRGGWIEINYAPVKAGRWRLSHPSRGGWIEMRPPSNCLMFLTCPTPHGVGGLKFLVPVTNKSDIGPTPHGVGGLKCNCS